MRRWVLAAVLALSVLIPNRPSAAQDRPEFAEVTLDAWSIRELRHLRHVGLIEIKGHNSILDGPEYGFQMPNPTRYEVGFVIRDLVRQWGLVPKLDEKSEIDQAKFQDILLALLFEYRDVFPRIGGDAATAKFDEIFTKEKHLPLNSNNWYLFLQTQSWAVHPPNDFG